MKILLTVVVSADVARSNSDTLYEGIELIYPEEGESGKEYLSRAVKAAKGKFTVIADRKFLFADVQSLLNIIDKNTADVVSFLGNIAVRTAVLKGIKELTDDFSLTLLGILGSKTVLKTVYNPFNFEHKAHAFTEENTTALLICAEAFGKVKAKLAKEIYSLAFGMLCDRLVIYYLYALLSIKDGNLDSGKLIAFDGKLKAEIVLYLALEKRFTYAKLQKLREKNFKISGWTARKFRKILAK